MSDLPWTERTSPEALGVLETETLHAGFSTVDVMAKTAPVEILAASPIPPGRFLIVIGGRVGEVESSWTRGCEVAGPTHDRLFLPEMDPRVLPALRPPAGQGGEPAVDTLGLFETASVSGCLDGADKGLKGAAVSLPQLHLARGIAGKSFGVFSGRQDMVEAALAIAEARARAHQTWVGASLLARPDAAVARRVLTRPWGFFSGQEIL